MRGFFATLPIHRKLIGMALVVSGASLIVAITGLVAFDAARFRSAVGEATRGNAQLLAENVTAAVVFEEPEAVRRTMSTIAVRQYFTHGCVYRADGSFLAGYSRSDSDPCPAKAVERADWTASGSVAPVQINGRTIGYCYVERSLADLRGRVMATAIAGLLTLMLAVVLAFEVARKLQPLISKPIVSLAHAAREIARDEHYQMPPIDAPPDETGALVAAFQEMVGRLVSSNEALRKEIEERRQMQTEREQLLSREREASRLKDEFLAAVSHELRTPLNAISGWTQVLATGRPNDQTLDKAIASILRNIEAQKRVIEDLLDVSRIIAGKLQMILTPVDLRTVVEAAVDVIVPAAKAKGVLLEVTLPDVACIAQMDFDRMRQVLWNMLSNGVKFTPSGGAVRVWLLEEERAYALVVSDTGIGISPAFLPYVFDRFRQADGSTTREYSGLGLGLAIVKELTELHGGAVSAASPGLGQGATFTVTLPKLVGVLDATAAAASSDASALPRLDGARVLAVDDNPDALEVLTSTLSGAGATVDVAASGVEALTRFREMRPDVVVCDLAMPGMDGFEVLRQIRRMEDGSVRPTPLIAITAYASAEYRDRCLAAGFIGHVPKPYHPRDVLREVTRAIARSRRDGSMPRAT